MKAFIRVISLCISQALLVASFNNINTAQEYYQSLDPSASSNLTVSQLDHIITRGYLKVGTTGDYKPFSYASDATNNTFIGADIDLATSLSSALGLNRSVEFVNTTWGNLNAGISEGRYDIAMGGVSINMPRALKGLFSVPYMKGGKAACVRCVDVEKYGSLEGIDQEGVRVVVNPGGTNEVFDRENLKKATIVLFQDNRLIFEELVEGRADVMITDGIEAVLQANLHPGVLCAPNPDRPFDFSEKAYLMGRDFFWKEVVDQWLHIQLESGAWNATLEKWLAYDWGKV